MSSDEFNKIISDIKIDLLLNQYREIFGVILSRINIILLDENSEDSFAYTDGNNIYFYPNWIDKLSYGNIEFIICHEIMHMILNHLTRQENRNSLLFNIASDYCVNYLLHNNISDGRRDPIGIMPEESLYDEQYANMSAEEIYDILASKNTNNENFAVIKGDISDDIISKIQNDDYQIEKSNGICVVDKRKKKVDDHSLIKEDVQRNFISEFSNDILKSFSKNNSADCIKRGLSKIRRVKFNWKQILKKYIRSMVFYNHSWRRPSKRGLSLNVYLPSVHKTELLKIAIAIDTSGSIEKQQLELIMNYVFECLHQFDNYEVYVWFFSGIVHENTFTKITKKNKFDLENISVTSNYSTNIRSNFKFVNENPELKDIDLFIVMTDGYDCIDDLSYNDNLLWFIIGNDNFINPVNCKKGKIINIPLIK